MKFKCDLTLQVPSGLGDLWWIQQKLLGAKIHWEVLITGNHEANRRSKEWLWLFPSTLSVSFVKVSPKTLQAFWKNTFELKDQYETQKYLANAWLESGKHLEALQPKGIGHFQLPMNNVIKESGADYDVFYVSRGAFAMKDSIRFKTKTWTINDWFKFFPLYWEKFGKRKTFLIGSAFDEDAMFALDDKFPELILWVGREAKDIVGLLNGCNRFVGYQSGLNVLADSMGVKQCMLYFEHLEKLMHSWNRVDNKQYSPFLFSDGPKKVIKSWM